MRDFKILFSYALILALACSCIVPACFSSSESEAKDKIRQTERGFDLALGAVSNAQLAGANVSALSEKLDDVAGLLADANNALRTRDYEQAVSLAAQCNKTLDGIADNAMALKVEAESAFKYRLGVAALFSIVGLLLLLAVSLFGWSLLKKRHLKAILKARPEVGGTE